MGSETRIHLKSINTALRINEQEIDIDTSAQPGWHNSYRKLNMEIKVRCAALFSVILSARNSRSYYGTTMMWCYDWIEQGDGRTQFKVLDDVLYVAAQIDLLF